MVVFEVGKGGNAQSKFEDRISGEGGPLCMGAVALRKGRPNGDRGDILRDGDALTGVN